MRVRPNARALCEREGIEWADEMSYLIYRKGRVSDITLRWVEVEFEDLHPFNMQKPQVFGKFKFSPHAIEFYEGNLAKMTRNLRHRNRAIRNYKAYTLAETMARADRQRGWYGNPFKSSKFATLLSMRDRNISGRKIKDVLGIRSITALWVQINKLQLNKAENDWLVEMLCVRYDQIWQQEDEKLRDQYLLALLTRLLEKNSLRLTGRLLRAIKERDFETLKSVGYKDLRIQYGIDIIALDNEPNWHELLDEDESADVNEIPAEEE